MKESNATGRRYECEFKQNAVELVRAGRTVSRVARDLGVSTTLKTECFAGEKPPTR